MGPVNELIQGWFVIFFSKLRLVRYLWSSLSLGVVCNLVSGNMSEFSDLTFVEVASTDVTLRAVCVRAFRLLNPAQVV